MKLLRVTCCLFILLLTLAAFVAVRPAAAQDLTPPPPLGATCHTTGKGIICQGSFTDSIVNSPIGVSCGSFQALESATSTNRFTVYYNQEGHATQGVFHIRLVGTLSNSMTGTSVPEQEDASDTVTFATPGDFSTVTSTLTGQLIKVTLPGRGLIVHDVGIVVFSPEGITFEGGPHQLTDHQWQQLCAALL